MRKFLGYSLTMHRQARLRIAPESIKRLTARVKELMRQGRGRSLSHTIEVLNPVLRGWINYFRYTQVKGTTQELDGWLRRRLRCLLWRQAEHCHRRQSLLRRQGLTEDRARRSARNGQGPWWNAGASHMNAAFPKRWFDALGLVSLLDTEQRLQRCSCNCRMRNRTYGGVKEGDGGQPRPLLDIGCKSGTIAASFEAALGRFSLTSRSTPCAADTIGVRRLRAIVL